MIFYSNLCRRRHGQSHERGNLARHINLSSHHIGQRGAVATCSSVKMDLLAHLERACH